MVALDKAGAEMIIKQSQTYHEPHPYQLGLSRLGTQQKADLVMRGRSTWKLVLQEC